jgi:hypothetical protein
MDIISNNIEKFYIIIGIFISSVFLRLIFLKSGQIWLKTQSSTLSVTLLPLITYVITSVISGNIALSLGMVGALSIVRFRNPVKSPLELVVYFLMITLGIAASVNIKWMVLMVIVTAAVILVFKAIDRLYRVVKKQSLFINSFSEANSQSTIEISSSTFLPELARNEHLVGVMRTGEQYQFRLASSNPTDIKNLLLWANERGFIFSYRES